MELTRATTFDEFITRSGWDYGSSVPSEVSKAYHFFRTTVSTEELNKLSLESDFPSEADSTSRTISLLDRGPRDSSPWSPLGIAVNKNQRTYLCALMQSIDFMHPVNPHRVLRKDELVVQLRFVGEPAWTVGNWFTYPTGSTGALALPDGQHWRRVYRVTRPIVCLESIAADNYTGWRHLRRRASDYWDYADRKLTDYHHGGGTQLFIYQRLHRSALVRID